MCIKIKQKINNDNINYKYFLNCWQKVNVIKTFEPIHEYD